MDKKGIAQLDARYFAVLASLFLTVYTLLFPEPLNDDSYLYIRTAELFVAEGLASAFGHYSWAAYSVMIGLVSQIGFSLTNSAFILNGLFFALLSFNFVALVRVFDKSQTTLWLAAICILIYPELNEYRYLIVRDVAFWALTLWSVRLLIQYFEQPDYRTGASFILVLLIATAFRIEALSYLIFAPIALKLLSQTETSTSALTKLLALTGVVLTFLAILMFLLGINFIELSLNFVAGYRQFLSGVIDADPARTAETSRAIFGDYAGNFSESYLTLFMITGLTSILLASILYAIGIPVVVLFLWTYFKNLRVSISKQHKTLLAFMLVNFLIVLIFIFVTRFLPSRYSMIFALLTIAFIPLLLSRLIDSPQFKLKSLQGVFLLILCVYYSFDSYYSFGKSKAYVDESIHWLVSQNVQMGELITNESAIAYGTEAVENYDRLPRTISEEQISLLKSGDYIAVHLRSSPQSRIGELESNGEIELMAAFPAGDEPRIKIYKAR